MGTRARKRHDPRFAGPFKYIGHCGDWVGFSGTKKEAVRLSILAAKCALPGHTADWWVVDTNDKIVAIGQVDENGKNSFSKLYKRQDRKKEAKVGRWDVDIRFHPSVCIHGVVASSPRAAREAVLAEIDSKGGLRLTDEQTRGLLADLFENVDEVECVGPSDQE